MSNEPGKQPDPTLAVKTRPSSIRCPGCDGQPEEHTLEGHYGRSVVVDACPECKGLWLDGSEGLQLGPGGVLSLIRAMDDVQRPTRAALKERMQCPRCGVRLFTTHDRQRDTTFVYERCPRGHGRYISFFQFLRSRNFVRELTEEELRDLRTHIQSVNCSNCGAPVEVARASACNYCHTPISTVEPGQLRKAIDELQKADAARRELDPMLPLRLLEERQAVEQALRFAERRESPMGGIIESVFHVLFRGV